MADMEWLKPIKDRLAILKATRAIPSDEGTTVDMLEADVRKLVLLIELTEPALAYQWSMPGTRAREIRDVALARLRSGEVEEKP